MSTYRSDKCRKKSLALYDKQMEKLNIPFEDIYVNTSFGRTHLIETGDKTGKPLLMFHGGKVPRHTICFNASFYYWIVTCMLLIPLDIREKVQK